MKSTNLIIVLCAIIVILAIIGAIYSTGVLSDNNKDNTTVNVTNNLSNDSDVGNIQSNDSDVGNIQSNNDQNQSSSKSDDVVSEEVKYNGQADNGSYYREVTYSDGGFRQYDTSSGELIGSSYDSDQKNLPSME